MLDKISAVFDSENPLMQALGTAGDLILLNAVTFLCMLPVVTYGAALTARDDILWHMVRGEGLHIIKPFFKSFKRNLRQGTVMGILFLLLGLFLIFDYDIVRSVPAMHSTVFYVMLILAGGFILAVSIYSFALLSRYENSVPKFRTGYYKKRDGSDACFFSADSGHALFCGRILAGVFCILSICVSAGAVNGNQLSGISMRFAV